MPSHNQKVERVIKLVSVTATKEIIQRDREGIVHSVLASREELPKFENMSHIKMKCKFGAARPNPKTKRGKKNDKIGMSRKGNLVQ